MPSSLEIRAGQGEVQSFGEQQRSAETKVRKGGILNNILKLNKHFRTFIAITTSGFLAMAPKITEAQEAPSEVTQTADVKGERKFNPDAEWNQQVIDFIKNSLGEKHGTYVTINFLRYMQNGVDYDKFKENRKDIVKMKIENGILQFLDDDGDVVASFDITAGLQEILGNQKEHHCDLDHGRSRRHERFEAQQREFYNHSMHTHDANSFSGHLQRLYAAKNAQQREQTPLSQEENCVNAVATAERDMTETDSSQYQKIRDAIWARCAGIMLNIDKLMYLLEVDGELLLHQGQYDSASGQFQKVVQRYNDNFKQSCKDKKFLGKTCHDVYDLHQRAQAGIQDAEELKQGRKTTAENLQKQKKEQEESNRCGNLYSWGEDSSRFYMQNTTPFSTSDYSAMRASLNRCKEIPVFHEYSVNMFIEEGEQDLRQGGREKEAKLAFKNAIQKYEDSFKQICVDQKSPDCNPVDAAHQHALTRLNQLDAAEAKRAEEQRKLLAEQEQLCKSLPALTTPINVSKANKMLQDYSASHPRPPCAPNVHAAMYSMCIQNIDVNGKPYYQGIFTEQTPYSIRRAGDDTYYIEPPRTFTQFADSATAVIDIKSKLPIPASVTVEYTTIATCTVLDKKRTDKTIFTLSSYGGDKRFIDLNTYGIWANCKLATVETGIVDCDF